MTTIPTYKEYDENIILKYIDDLIFILNNELKCEYLNSYAIYKELGYKENFLENSDFFDLIYNEDFKDFKKFISYTYKKGKGTIEVRLLSKKKKYKWYEISGKRITLDDQNKLLLIAKNISKFKKLEKKFKDSEERLKVVATSVPEIRFWKFFQEKKCIVAVERSREMLRSIIDNIPQLIYWKDFSNVSIGCNLNFAKINGFNSTDDIIGINDSDLPIFRDNLKILKELENISLENKKALIHINKSLKFNSSIKHFDISIIPIFDKDDKIVGLIYSLEDITERYKLEQQLRELNKELERRVEQRTKELRESEEKFRTMAEQSQIGIAILQDNKLVYHNKAFSLITEFEEREIHNSTVKDIYNNIYPEDLEMVKRIHLERQKNGINKHVEYSHRIITKSGKLKWIQAFVKSIPFKGNTADLITIIDITERMEAEEKLKKSEQRLRVQNEQLLKLDKLKNDFITMAAHELKTPLISIRGYPDYILTKYRNELSEEMIDDLERVEKNARTLEKYIDQLTDVMTIDAERLTLNKKEYNICEIVKKCIDSFSLLLDKKKISIKTYNLKDIFLSIDQEKIEKVFSNLILNAIKFSNKNSKIEISSSENDDEIIFKVKDYGKGISKENIGKIFNKFVKLEKGEDIDTSIDKGMGLGLYISKGIVEAHGGKIWAESEGLGKGAEFIFTLPKS
ncbi:MAG: PAS domain S-box protein [Promethearchaeota archaeon]